MSSRGKRKPQLLLLLAGLSNQPRARHLHLSCSAGMQVVHSSTTRVHAHAACKVAGAERVFVDRFCWINGSRTSPQLIHRSTVSAEYSGLDSTIIRPLHF